MILTITIQFRLHEGQLISRIQKRDKRYILGQGKKRSKLLKKLYCRVLLIPITVLPKKKKIKKKKEKKKTNKKMDINDVEKRAKIVNILIHQEIYGKGLS